MLLKEKLKQINFSPSEREVIRFLQANETTLADRTIQQIAETCYVHPSTLIRIAKKMGFHGWVDFRDAFIAETEYLQGNFQEVDANLPFSENEGIMTIANRIAALERMTIQDTLSLLMHDDLQQAKQLLLRSNKIILFSSDTNTLIAQSFKLKMNRIKQEVTIVPTSGESYYDAYNCQPENCAILISYTGENQMMLRTAEILKEKNVPILSLTSIGESSLSTASDVVLRLTTRERLYSKISSFTINTSISYLLDVLYSCVFAEHYRENLDYLIEVGQKVDTRQISSSIMKEELFTDSIADGD